MLWPTLPIAARNGTHCTELRFSRPTRASYHRASKKRARRLLFDRESCLQILQLTMKKPRAWKMRSTLYKPWRAVCDRKQKIVGALPEPVRFSQTTRMRCSCARLWLDGQEDIHISLGPCLYKPHTPK